MDPLAQSLLNHSLWQAFHDSIVERFEVDGDSVTVQLRTNFPNRPTGSPVTAVLTFTRVESLSIESLTSENEPRVPVSLERLWFGLSDDTLDVCDAAWSPGPPLKVGLEALFWNVDPSDDLGGVLIVITADQLEVTADGGPSSLEEWMAWGTAGWEQFPG